MKKIISPITGESKYLLIENSEVISEIKVSQELKESLKLSAGKSGTLIVKNLPGTILNRENQNGRIYSTAVLAEAIKNAKQLFETKQLLSQACEHPEGSFVSPTTASHVVTNAYIKRNVKVQVDEEVGTYDMLFMDIEVLNTDEGKNLRALLEAECSVGTSIRGVGDMEGKYVKNYEILGIDFVGNPSSSTFTRMPVSESVKMEVKDSRALTETFTVNTSSTNVTRDLEQAAVIQQQVQNAQYGTVTKTSSKLDQETDPKTGAQTSMTTFETETSDDVADLDQALQMAKNAMLNNVTNVTSITIEKVEEEGETKEAVEYVPEKTQLNEKPIVEAKEKDSEEDPNLGKKFVLHTDRGFVTYDKNAIDFTNKPEDALHFTEGKEENGMVSMSKVTEILDAMGIFEVEKYFQKSDISLDGNEKSTDDKETSLSDGLIDGDINVSANIGDVGFLGGQGSVGKDENIQEENGSNTKYFAEVHINGNGGDKQERIPVSSVDLESAKNEVSNLYDMKVQGNEGSNVSVQLVDSITGSTLTYNPETKLFDGQEQLPESSDDPVEIDDNTVTTHLDDDDIIEKEFDSPLQAKVAVDAVAQGKADPKVLVPEAINEEEVICNWCKGEQAKCDCKKEKDLGWLCPQCERSLESQGVELEFENGIDEKLYTSPDEPSDPIVQQPLEDATSEDFTVTLSDIDWDIDNVDPKFLAQIENLPDTIDVRVRDTMIDTADSPEDLKAAILAGANETMNPFSIKNGNIISIKDTKTGEILA